MKFTIPILLSGALSISTSDIDKLDINKYKVAAGKGSCYKCMKERQDPKRGNVYAIKDPRCSPLVLNLFGTQYEEWTWWNLIDGAEQGDCFMGNPEDFAQYASVAAINCYDIARFNWECPNFIQNLADPAF